jgi:hypothetical protein
VVSCSCLEASLHVVQGSGDGSLLDRLVASTVVDGSLHPHSRSIGTVPAPPPPGHRVRPHRELNIWASVRTCPVTAEDQTVQDGYTDASCKVHLPGLIFLSWHLRRYCSIEEPATANIGPMTFSPVSFQISEPPVWHRLAGDAGFRFRRGFGAVGSRIWILVLVPPSLPTLPSAVFV